MNHKQVPVKVNVLADEGIADLVEALSEIEGLRTLHSCQGDPGVSGAYVKFQFGNWEKCGDLLYHQLMPKLPPELLVWVTLVMEVHHPDHPVASFQMHPRYIQPTTEFIRSIAKSVGARDIEQAA